MLSNSRHSISLRPGDPTKGFTSCPAPPPAAARRPVSSARSAPGWRQPAPRPRPLPIKSGTAAPARATPPRPARTATSPSSPTAPRARASRVLTVRAAPTMTVVPSRPGRASTSQGPTAQTTIDPDCRARRRPARRCPQRRQRRHVVERRLRARRPRGERRGDRLLHRLHAGAGRDEPCRARERQRPGGRSEPGRGDDLQPAHGRGRDRALQRADAHRLHAHAARGARRVLQPGGRAGP